MGRTESALLDSNGTEQGVRSNLCLAFDSNAGRHFDRLCKWPPFVISSHDLSRRELEVGVGGEIGYADHGDIAGFAADFDNRPLCCSHGRQSRVVDTSRIFQWLDALRCERLGDSLQPTRHYAFADPLSPRRLWLN